MKALVLAGGFPQIALIKELKSRGIEVLLADYNKEPVAKKYADKYFMESTLDIEAIKRIAVDEKVDFLITVCTDQSLHTVAKVSEELGLPCYIDYQTAINVTNKQYMKKRFSEAGIPTAKHIVADSFDESLVSGLRFPLIVKPVDCNSSKGVRKCANIDETKKHFEEAVKLSRTDTAVIEEYIEGAEVSVDVYVENGKANVLCVSNSDKIADADKFVICRAIYPAAVSEAVLAKIESAAQQIADAFEIKNSPMLIQFLTDGENAYVIEFSARTGGGVKYLLIKHVSGFDVIKAVVDLTLGEKVICHVNKPLWKYVVNDFIYCKPGAFDHLENFDELKKAGVITDYYLFKWKGAEFSDINASGDRIAGYTISADDVDDIVMMQKKANREIKVLSPNGEDIARHDLLKPLCFKNGFLKTEE